ncbi:MAG TPA: alpha/beta fold hydrolase [Solirubrobacteraceae bacterium]|nr:alpha/beta fold hydrolase [Solirubrobacteraceae bacterium]
MAACVCSGFLAGFLAAPSQAQIEFAACGDSNDYACGHLTVPLDPSGQTAGAVTLAIRRHRAPAPSSAPAGNDAVIALAGGPGQAAIPLADTFAQVLGPIVSTRDLIVYDQRGTGLSGALSCAAFEKPKPHQRAGVAIPTCANQIGARRAYFTTTQSVTDIEAIRQAGGYDKLVLYGTSYGTRVAEQYAQDYPTHVEALILDSVVPPVGQVSDSLQLPTFAAVPRILSQLCADGACAHISRHPSDDLRLLIARMHGKPLRTRWIDARGRAHELSVSSDDLLNILVTGDFNLSLRVDFPAAVRSAFDGDYAALGRLAERLKGATGSDESDINGELYATTVCEEQTFPWDRAAAVSARLKQVETYLNGLPRASIAPFGPRNVQDLSDASLCAFWPFATRAPELDAAPLPNVPTLILSGADDLRTPTAQAHAVAAQIPDAQLLVVPDVGHAVLLNDFTTCSADALKAFFAGTPIKSCKGAPTVPRAFLGFLSPSPIAPRRLTAVTVPNGTHGLPGRTLEAVALTLRDVSHQLLLQGSFTKNALRAGGLRGGSVRASSAGIVLRALSYVPGVTVSGHFVHVHGTLHSGGSAAARGVLHMDGKRLSGVLGGKHVQLNDFAGLDSTLLASGARAVSAIHFG